MPSLGEQETLAEMMERLGRGGINRGRGDTPMFYGDEQDLGTNNLERVSNPDLSRATPGDVLGLGETEHDDEKAASKRQAGGEISGRGQGGDAIWRDVLMPEEKAALKRYFK